VPGLATTTKGIGLIVGPLAAGAAIEVPLVASLARQE
jgi:hypothetical protein